jgi:hypothetical protein
VCIYIYIYIYMKYLNPCVLQPTCVCAGASRCTFRYCTHRCCMRIQGIEHGVIKRTYICHIEEVLQSIWVFMCVGVWVFVYVCEGIHRECCVCRRIHRVCCACGRILRYRTVRTYVHICMYMHADITWVKWLHTHTYIHTYRTRVI